MEHDILSLYLLHVTLTPTGDSTERSVTHKQNPLTPCLPPSVGRPPDVPCSPVGPLRLIGKHWQYLETPESTPELKDLEVEGVCYN